MNKQDDLVALEALFRDRAGEWFLYGWDGNRIANVLKAALSAAAKPVEPQGKNWHAHHAAVNKAALQMVRNALRNDAEKGLTVRGEMLAELDAATFAIPAPGAEQAKPAMTSEDIKRCWHEVEGFRHGYGPFARAIERHLAAAWGVKLEGGV